MKAPKEITIKSIAFKEGSFVEAGSVLVTFE